MLRENGNQIYSYIYTDNNRLFNQYKIYNYGKVFGMWGEINW